jgi:hypothetical protein
MTGLQASVSPRRDTKARLLFPTDHNRGPRGSEMAPPIAHRRLPVSGLIVAPLSVIARAAPATAQSAAAFPPIVQAREKNGPEPFAIRPFQKAIRPTAPLSWAMASSWAKAEITWCCRAIPPPTPSFLRFVMRPAGSTSATSPIVMSTQPPRLARCARVLSIGPASAATTTRALPRVASLLNSPASRRPGLIALTTFMPSQLGPEIQARRKMV